MPNISSISRHELLNRRRRLRRQRRVRLLQLTWRAVIVVAVAMGVTWLITRPDWMLRDANQVIIEGNKSVPTETIRSLLPLKYPQFLLTLQPKEIAHRLESQAAIAGVTVNRSLFPPSLTIYIQERYPVAVVYGANAGRVPQPALPQAGLTQAAVLSEAASSEAASSQPTPIALLDERGNIMDYQNYIALNQSQSLPSLKVIALREAERLQWTRIYQQVSRSPVKVFTLDWTNPSNLVLQTELGMVRIGGYSAQKLPEQLRVLDRMRQLPKQFPLESVEHIDLKDPKKPFLKMAGFTPANSSVQNSGNAAANSVDALAEQSSDAPTDDAPIPASPGDSPTELPIEPARAENAP